jgi:hypothetical protein
MESFVISPRPAHLQGERPEHSPPPPRDAAAKQGPATILIANSPALNHDRGAHFAGA